MNAPSEVRWRELCALFEDEMRTHQIPGASLGVIAGGESFAAGFGVTSVDNPLPVDPDTLFQIGSITKTFTCAAAMRLVEAGKLGLEDRVRGRLPAFRVADEEASSGATVWHLLTHTAGWMGDLFIDTGPGEDAMARYVTRMSDLPQVAPLGLQYSYNNASFSVLGRLLELVEGEPFEHLVRRLIFEPAGLTQCYFRPQEVMTRRFVVGHRVDPDGAHVVAPWALPRCDAPMGGIITNVQDLLVYARVILDGGRTRDGTQLLSGESLAAMQAEQARIWRETESIGLAWHVERREGRALFNHGGATLGQGAFLEVCPEHGFALVVQANADTADHLVHSIRRQALESFVGVHLPEPKSMEMDAAVRKEVEGRYVLPGHSYLDIRSLAGKLIGQEIHTGGFPSEDTPPEPTLPPFTLECIEPDRLVIADGKDKDTICDILRGEDGRMKWFRKSGRIHLREPIPDD